MTGSRPVLGLVVPLLLLSSLLCTQTVADPPVCGSQCTCQGRIDGTRFKVECTQGDIDDIGSLGLPSTTTQLSIVGAKLTKIDRDDLSILTNLDKLNLSGNSISSIEPGAFSGLQALTRLDLSNNRLNTINNSIFTGLSQLKRLSLSGNVFQTLPGGVFRGLTQLNRVDFNSSNLACDCRMESLLEWAQVSKVNILDTVCAQPASLTGTLVKNLDLSTMNCGNTGGIKVFELDPATTQLVFTNDTLPIDCTVSTEYVKHVNWYRNDRLVSTNISAKIEVVVKQTPPSLLTKTLILRNLTKERTGLWSCIANDGQTNFTKSLSIFTEPASCPEVTTETDKGKYKWPRTGHDSRAELMCKSGAKAYYTCNADAQWVDLDTQGCKYSSDITQLLWELSLSDFNITTSVEMVKTLMKMLMQSSDIISHKIDVIYVARVLSRISSSYYLYSKAEIPQMVFNITSLMMNVNSSLLMEAEIEKRACTSMRANLETVVNYMLDKQSEYSLYMDNIAMQSRKYTPTTSFIGLLCTALQISKTAKTYLPNNFYCIDQAATPDFAKSKNQKVDALIHIPADVVVLVPTPRYFKLMTIIYRSDHLYPSNTTGTPSPSSKYFIPSPVISTRVIGTEVRGLSSTPLTVALPRQDYVDRVPNVQAVSWDSTNQSWRRDGCRISNTLGLTNHNLSIIECDHMASYSLLQERLKAEADKEFVDHVGWFFVHRPQFYVGAFFLCLCLITVLLTYTCTYRTILLSKKLKHSIINTCLSVLLLKLVFILGIKTYNDIGCKVFGMAIHYFSLTTVFWLTVTTWNIYKKMSGRSHRHLPTEDGAAPLPPNPMLKFYLFAWGVPIIVCGITGAVSIEFYQNKFYCFVHWSPGLLSYYGPVGLFFLINCILYICICSSKHNQHTKVYIDDMLETTADSCLDTHNMDDSMSNNGSEKSSVADAEYRPLTQLAGIVLFLLLYLCMWAGGAASIVLPSLPNMEQLDIILSYFYMILCVVFGIFLVVFYCFARNDTRAMWQVCHKNDLDSDATPPRSNTNINVISHANAHKGFKHDDDSSSSLKASSTANQPNPLLQIMQYHKKSSMMSHSMTDSHRADSSVQGAPDDGPVFFNAHQNGVAKRYWERKRNSRDRSMNHSMMSVPETGRVHTHSPTNTEPGQHMSIEIQIKSHNSKQAKRHRLGSTNSEPADVRNKVNQSMGKSSHQLHTSSYSAHNGRQREPTIGQCRTPSESGRNTPQFYRYPPDMWQSSVPRNPGTAVQRTVSPSIRPCGYMKPPSLQYERDSGRRKPLSEQAYVHTNYMRSMRDSEDNSDDESHYSHRSKRSSHRSGRHRHRQQRQHMEAEGRKPAPSALNESYASLQSHSTARSHHSSRSGRSTARKNKAYNGGAEERPLLQISQSAEHEADDGSDKLNINHSSSDNNSSHYACASLHESKELNNTNLQLSTNTAFSAPQNNKVPVELSDGETTGAAILPELSLPEERIYENAHNIVSHEKPVYTNLEELRQRVAAKRALQSPETADGYELPVYENLFSLNEYDTLRKQKHHANKGLPLPPQSPAMRVSPPQCSAAPPSNLHGTNCDSSL